MKKFVAMMLVLSLIASLAFAQVDKATGTVTNDETQARLRLGHFVYGGPNVALYVDGQVAVNGGQPQVDIPVGYVSGYLYLEPGSYRVAVVATGEKLAQALIGPLDMSLEAGHRYTLAMMGQIEDENLKPLVVDETEELEKVGATPGSLIAINNIAGTTTIDFDAYRGGPHNIPYGGFDIAFDKGFAITANNDPNAFIEGPHPDDPPPEPGLDVLNGFMGRYPGTMGDGIDVGDSAEHSDLDALTFLQNSSGYGTFLDALRTAGLTDLLKSGGPYMLFIPTDEAFAALPEEELDALMADPEALADLLRNHIVEAYVPRGSQTKTPGGQPFDRVFTNLLGETIKIGDGYTVNGTVEDTAFIYVANGTQIHPIRHVLQPPEQ